MIVAQKLCNLKNMLDVAKVASYHMSIDRRMIQKTAALIVEAFFFELSVDSLSSYHTAHAERKGKEVKNCL